MNKTAGYICIDLGGMIIVWNDWEGWLHIVVEERDKLLLFFPFWKQGNAIQKLEPCNTAYCTGPGMELKIAQHNFGRFRFCAL